MAGESPKPILRLPFELTSKIFVHCTTDSSDLHSAPLLLGWVCRHWRSIALSCPELWSSFTKVIRVDKSLDVAPSRYTALSELLQIWLARSATLPLTLTLHYHGIRIRPTPAPIHSLLLQHADRWEHLDLGLPHSDLVQLFQTFTGTFPSLQTLSIGIPHHGDPTPPLAFGPLRSSILLRSLAVNFHCIQPSRCEIPWTNLTTFHGQELSLTAALEILRLSPSLRDCHMTLPPNIREPSTSHTPLRLPELRALTIDSDEGSAFLPYLTLPVLQHLSCPYLDHTRIQHILDFLSRSLCPLTSLSTLVMYLDELDFAALFTALPHLAELNLTLGIDSPMPVVSLLHRQKQLLPRLRTLTLGGGGAFAYGGVVDMLESRTDPQLQSFRYTHAYGFLLGDPSSPPSADIMERVEALMGRGMDVQFDGV
ncbi:hypothetical protein C8R46DRAFT_956671 [Mycena filopes]|nr:hypothetical protein C8R46DRAFT_956671 [Mycena filopes]